MNITSKLMAASFIAALAFSAPADAKNDKHGRSAINHKYDYHYDHDRHDRYDRRPHRAGHDNVIIIDNSDRVVIREYMSDRYHKKCPPGLAKKRNHCTPPGHARRYTIGEPLRVTYYPVPEPLLIQLDPVPYGYRYVRVDQDVLLISEASKKVIDAVTLLSAVGR